MPREEITKYFTRPGFRLRTNAQTVGEELERLRKKHGGTLTTAVVVVEAKKKSNPIHNEFDWDDKTAAKQYRLTQAGYLMRAVEIELTRPDTEEPQRTRMYFVVRPPETPVTEEGEYRHIRDIVSSEDTQKLLISQAKREGKEWMARYRHIKELIDWMVVELQAESDR